METVDIEEATVLVTGAANGIGLAIVNSFLQHGAKFAIIIDINEEKGNKELKTLKSKYGDNKVAFYKCDVAHDSKETFDKIIDTYKNVDILVNNAGILDEGRYERVIDVNIKGLIEWCTMCYDHMRQDRGGRGGTIVNISSICGYMPSPYVPNYSATKFAAIGFSQSLGHDLHYKRTGVRVIVICPSKTDTDICKCAAIWDKELLPAYLEVLNKMNGQSCDDVGKGAIEIYQKAKSGEVWLLEGGRGAEKLNINSNIVI